jgi:hypothetical protein
LARCPVSREDDAIVIERFSRLDQATVNSQGDPMRSHPKASTLCGLLLAGLLAPLGSPLPAQAATLYVNPWVFVGNDGNNSCRVEATPCFTIGHAVWMASSNDVIVLSSWSFLAFGDTNVVVDKNLTFIGVAWTTARRAESRSTV